MAAKALPLDEHEDHQRSPDHKHDRVGNPIRTCFGLGAANVAALSTVSHGVGPHSPVLAYTPRPFTGRTEKVVLIPGTFCSIGRWLTMNRANEYRARATECETRAETTENHIVRRDFQDMARQWREMAKQIEQLELERRS